MATKAFKTESKKLLDMMVHSIYSHKEIFLREIISNSSDAIDKIYYKALTDDSLSFNKDDYYIRIIPDKQARTLTISDTGIGMTQEELENNLGTIAQSGSLNFKHENEAKDGHSIIGQFGVGFYSAFMVADKVTVISKALGSDQAYKWESESVEGYTIEPCEKEAVGTDVILQLKENTDDEKYDDYLDENQLQSIIKKYSDYIRYPIKMTVTESRPKKDNEKEFEEVRVERTINSMIPLWRKNKNELKDEDYENFYNERHYGYDKPLTHLNIQVDGTIRYHAILYIPESIPFNYYTKDYEKGLELYSNGVMIMEKCADLLPDYFSFVKGVVDSEDLSLNVSREMLQQDRQLQIIAKNIRRKIQQELQRMLKEDREKYEKFFQSFGRQLKYGVYMDFGAHKEELQDLLLFYSSKEKKMVTLDEYVARMPDEQKYIYYAVGQSNEKIDKLPQTELVTDKGYEILYFTDEIDEFAIKMLNSYKDKAFKSVASSDLGLENDEEKQKTEAEDKVNKDLFGKMKSILADKVKDVRASKRLKTHPVCFATEGEVSIEMEKVLNQMPNDQKVKADKVLEVNTHHNVFKALKAAYDLGDEPKVQLYTNLLYDQALMIEGLPVPDPVTFANDICKLMD
ncbi:MAG: molecular chaperone HtpG [Sporolactobacillus sp.]|jgi:molecular chaperone HtpG|nr:molecular chaperone HtpG [Sporolactobacillus sp.]MCI1881312.1 molecular chaperone HtpG [Sporolactobacillus sp.]